MALLRSLSLWCVVSVSAPALAQTTIKDAPASSEKEQDAALQHFRLGVEFYSAGNYGAARVEFEAALGLSKLPDLLHNLSLTAEKQGLIGEAIDYGRQGQIALKEMQGGSWAAKGK